MTRQVRYTPSTADLTLNNFSYIGGTQSPAVSGQNSRIQLFNPVDSGINIVLLRFRARSAAGDQTVIRPTQTPLTTLTTDTFNKLVSSNARLAIAEIRTDSVADAGGGSKQEGIIEIIATEVPVLIASGFGVNLEGIVKNTEVGAEYEWLEVPA